MSSRELILNHISQIKYKKVFNSLEEPEWMQEALQPITKTLLQTFRDELEAVNGACIVLDSWNDFKEQLKVFAANKEINKIACVENDITAFVDNQFLTSDTLNADASLTGCEALIARTGSVMVSSAVAKSRKIQIFPPIHMVVTDERKLVPYLDDALTQLRLKYGEHLPSQVSLITGPSRTADIEKTLVLGAHGPKELIVFIIRNS